MDTNVKEANKVRIETVIKGLEKEISQVITVKRQQMR